MTTVTQYRLFCVTENCWVSGFGTDAPTTCYHNSTDTINSNSIQVLARIANTQVVIEEQTGPLQVAGFYAAHPFSFTAGGMTTTVFNNSLPFATSVLTCHLQVSPDMVGDNIGFTVGANTKIGAITADAAVGVKIVSVTPTVIQYANVGYYLTISDGINSNLCGRVLAIDPVASTVAFEIATTTAFSAASPSGIFITRSYLDPYDLNVSGIHEVGFGKIGGSYMPANTVGTATYINRSSTAKRVTFMMEHLY